MGVIVAAIPERLSEMVKGIVDNTTQTDHPAVVSTHLVRGRVFGMILANEGVDMYTVANITVPNITLIQISNAGQGVLPYVSVGITTATTSTKLEIGERSAQNVGAQDTGRQRFVYAVTLKPNT